MNIEKVEKLVANLHDKNEYVNYIRINRLVLKKGAKSHWAKTYSYLIDNGSKDKKAKGTKKGVIKRKLKFKDYKNCLKATQLENKINKLEKTRLMQEILEKTIINS